MQLDPPASRGDAPGQVRRALAWSGLILLAAVALVLALVIGSLVLELGSEPTPAPAPPMQISHPGGHAMAQ